MNRRTPRSLLFLLTGFVLSTLLAAQDVRELDVPTAHQYYRNVTASTITSIVNTGYRVVDIEYRSGSGSSTRFDVALVRNTGSYAATWWWYYGVSLTTIGNLVSSNNGRLIDLEAYTDSNGTLRYTCVMVSNSGANQKAWWYYVGQSVSSLSSFVAANNARLVDVDEYLLNGQTRYLGVMIRNTGADHRTWWWYVDQPGVTISGLVNTNQARLYDLDRRSNGNFNAIMIRDVTPKTWHYWTGLTSESMDLLIGNYGVRPIDIEKYTVGLGFTRYTMVTLNNVSALATAVGADMRATTDGQVGCWLNRINGANLADLNGDAVFEPASTMKTLHHVHAARRISLGAVSANQLIPVYPHYQFSDPSCPVDTGVATGEPIVDVLREMMENSDNARTQAITAAFGESNINGTALQLGMTSTSLNHRLGCGVPALADPNQITLRDLHRLHTEVANGYLGNWRANFYELMLDSVGDLGLSNLIQTEAQSLGLSYVVPTFLSNTAMVHKGGNYSLNNGSSQWFERAEFGWLSLPIVVNNAITAREYTFGAFVNDASTDLGAQQAIYSHAIPELLRGIVRGALLSWNGTAATTAPFGTGCNAAGLDMAQYAFGFPAIGTSMDYTCVNAHPTGILAWTFGLSDTSWNGAPLPASIALIGGEPGCQAYNDILFTDVGIASAFGTGSIVFPIPNDVGLIGFEYFTQFWSFGPGSVRTSNGRRNTVGL